MDRDSHTQPDFGAFLASIPTPVLQTYQKQGGMPADLAIALSTDLSTDGSFGEQWLLVDHDSLQVLARKNGSANLVTRQPIATLQDVQIEPCVGNGLMKVTVDETPQVLLHFSNELTERFALAAHYLRQRITQPAEAPIPDFSTDGQRCLSCGRRLLDPSLKVCPSCIKRGQVFRRLVLMARPYWKLGLLHFGLMLTGVLVDLMPPYLTRVLIDDVLTTQLHVNWLGWLVLGLLGLQVVRVTITISDALLTNRISTSFAAGVREKMFAHLKSLSQEFYDRNETGRLLTRINQDTEELQGLINQMSSFLLYAVLVVGIGIVLFSMAPFLGLFVLAPAPFVIVATFFYHRRMNPHFRRYWISRWRLNSMLSTFLSGIQVVKAFGQDDQEEQRYRSLNSSALDSRLRVDQAWGRFFPLISFAFGAGGLLIWYAGGNAVLEDKISLGTLMAFLSYLGMFYGPLSNMAQISQAVNRFTTISQRTFEFLDEVPKVQQKAASVSRPALDGRIEFDDVSLATTPISPCSRMCALRSSPAN
jgi:ATP-binding cassette, subfamily B, bacterial